MNTTNNVVDLQDARIRKFARDFVDIYEEQGENAAGVFAVRNLKDEEYGTAKVAIEAEFLSRGYAFSQPTESI